MKFLPKLENTDLRTKLFIVLAVIGCISNAGGFIANAVMFGFTFETAVCGASLLIVILSFIYGVMTGHTYRATIILLIVLSIIEFPILYFFIQTDPPLGITAAPLLVFPSIVVISPFFLSTSTTIPV